MRLDSHQHFWRYHSAEHGWMDDRMAVLKRDYLPENLQPLLSLAKVDGTIAVQARQTLEETNWLLELASQNDFIKGVVGWVNLRSPELRGQLEKFAKHPKFVGVRHVVHDELDDEFMLRADFRRGLAQLREFGLTYDLLLFPKHLSVAAKLVAGFPTQKFVLDHLGKPRIGEKLFSPWQEDLAALAKFPNVHCKLSGMVTETHWNQWRSEDFQRYLDIALAAFGADRLMIGSDWPVCNLSGDYATVMKIVTDYIAALPAAARAKILGKNCAHFYNLKLGAETPAKSA
jgi:L-fuconolactonase